MKKLKLEQFNDDSGRINHKLIDEETGEMLRGIQQVVFDVNTHDYPSVTLKIFAEHPLLFDGLVNLKIVKVDNEKTKSTS